MGLRPKALIIGGTGQIGFATASKLLSEGWTVFLNARKRPNNPVWHKNLQYVLCDRQDVDCIISAIGSGVDLVLDCIAFDDRDAKDLVRLSGFARQIAVISSASVYRDARGRTLDEASQTGFPQFPNPMDEVQATVPSGPQTYSTRKIRMENYLQEYCNIPVSILRPCAIYGPRSKHAREWYFVKRIRDGRPYIPVAYMGESRFHTTSTALIADVIHYLSENKKSGVFNVMDGAVPSVFEIGQTIVNFMGSKSQIIPVPFEFDFKACHTPWSVPNPVILTSKFEFIRNLSRRSSYCSLVGLVVDNLMNIDLQNWSADLPVLNNYPRNLFDYYSEGQIMKDMGIAQ